MSHTIPQVAADANALFAALTADLTLNLDLPQLDLDTDFTVPTPTGPGSDPIPAVTVADLTTAAVDGTGVFDVMMRAVNTHLEAQFQEGRITGADFAKVYLGAITVTQQTATQFVLGKDRAYWENLQSQAQLRLAQAQEVRALADIQIARGEIQKLAYENAEMQLKARTAFNQLASSKMALVTGYNEILQSENQAKLLEEQVDAARAQTKDTLLDGTPILGVVALEKDLKTAQIEQMQEQGALTREQVDTARAETKNTLADGSAVSGMAAQKKLLLASQVKTADEQYEVTRAQIRDTLSTGAAIAGILGVEKQIKVAQKNLTEEQNDTQRAQTKETTLSGQAILGIAKYEKDLKSAQAKLVLEQYESQRGQTRGTLSTGEPVIGLIGTQTRLYEQQITSYKRDAETKYVKMVMDTWTARKTIDEGVLVPTTIDKTAIEGMTTSLQSNLGL